MENSEKKKLTADEIVIKEMINANIKNTNDHSRPQKIWSFEVLNLRKTKWNISDIKKELKNLDKNIKEVEDDLLDPHYVSSKLIKLRGSFTQK